LPTIFNAISLWKMNGRPDLPLNIIDDGSEVPTSDIALDDNPALDSLSHDEVRSTILADLGQRRKRDLGASRSVDLDSLDLTDAGRFVAAVADDEWKARLTFECTSARLTTGRISSWFAPMRSSAKSRP